MTSESFSKNAPAQKVVAQSSPDTKKRPINWRIIIVLSAWTYASYFIASIIISVLIGFLTFLGVDFALVGKVMFSTIVQLVLYILATALVIGVPLWLFKQKTTLKELGLNDLVSWLDIGMAIPAYVAYMIINVFVMMAVTKLPFIDPTQAQQLPFERSFFFTQVQYVMIFLTIVVLAPLAEEVLFRGYLFGKIRKLAPFWLSAIMASLTFGLAHLWAGPGTALQWLVAIDTFVLSLVLCLLREHTGAIWAGVLVHAIKNGIAFYFVYLNPQTLDQIQAGIVLFL